MKPDTKIYPLLISLLFSVSACTNVEDNIPAVPSNCGVLYLSTSSNDIFLPATRSSSLDDYTFTLSDGATIIFTDGKAIIPAGDYTISATNAATVADGYEGMLFSGEQQFTLAPGGTANITIDMGKAKNSKVSYTVSDNFLAAYTIQSFSISGSTRSHTFSSAGEEKFVPAGTVTYNITAKANKGSHVQEFTTVSGAITTLAATHHTISLDVNPITGYFHINVGDDYSGEFE